MSDDQASEERALAEGVGVVDRSDRGKIQFKGQDRVAFLQRMLTNTVEGLEPGQGTRAELLDVRGRVICDLRLSVAGDRVHADVEPEFLAETVRRLSMFVLRDDVQIEDVTDRFALLTVSGPEAAACLEGAGAPGAAELERYAHTDVTLAGVEVTLVRSAWTTADSFDLVFDAKDKDAVRDALMAAGAQPVGRTAFEVARICAGVARQGHELVDDYLPLEAGLFGEAITEKGCYPGQEVIIRIVHRGKTNRTLVGLIIEGQGNPGDGKLTAGGRDVGRVTSHAWSKRRECTVALAIVRREHAEPGTQLELAGSPATVRALPM